MRPLFLRGLIAPLMLSLLALSLASIRQPTTSYAQDADAPNATIALPAPGSLDPVGLSRFDDVERDLIENLFVGLTRLNARSGQIEPWLAESWTVSDDGLVWTFSLREDMQWVQADPTTGQVNALRPVVAEDVVFAIQRGCDPRRPSPLTDNLYVLEGCRLMNTNNSLQAPALEQIGVSAIDATTVEFRLLFPAAYFLTLTSLPEYRPLPAEFVSDDGLGWPRPDAIVTSGAWAIESWTPNSAMRLVSNPHWPVETDGNLGAVDIRFNVPIDTLATDIQSDVFDYAQLVPVVASILGNSQPEMLQSTEGQTLSLVGFSFNLVDREGAAIPSPLDNPGVRRALALALDRDQLAAAIYQNGAQGSDHFTPRSAMAGPSAPGARFDPAAAQASLSAAGYATCADLGVLPIAVREDDPVQQLLAQNMANQWATTLGCPLETFPVTPIPQLAIIDSAHGTVDVFDEQTIRYPLWIITWTADYPDAQAWVTDALHCETGYFRVGRACNQTDALMRQAETALDITARFNAYNQVESDFFGTNGGFPVVPLMMEREWWAQAETLSGVGGYGPLQFDRWVLQTE